MPSAPIAYRRLPGRGTTLAHYVRLYQGPDHFLQAASTGWNETYKRFYFREIQAVVIQRTLWQHAWTAAWGASFALFGTLALGAGGDAGIVLGVIAGFFLLCLLTNVGLGDTCNCYIRTAVQTEKLQTLTRVRTARRFLARVRPVIEQAQAGGEPASEAGPSATPV
jgi:hypothetical protein